jgi:hypothetical protein
VYSMIFSPFLIHLVAKAPFPWIGDALSSTEGDSSALLPGGPLRDEGDFLVDGILWY